jgi:hypothetical protein
MLAGTLALGTITASANHAMVSAELSCTSATKVCMKLTIVATDFNETHTLHLALLGRHKGADDFTKIGDLDNVTVSTDGTTTPTVCLDNVTTSDFVSFKLQVTAGDAGVTLADVTTPKVEKSTVTLGPFDNSCPAMQTSPSPSPSPTTTTAPSTSPTANTAAVLAQTGGFDFRFPLIGLVLLVAGGALFLVSASRGRSAGSK